MKSVYDVIKKPLVTEKAALQKDAFRKYVFEVAMDSTKEDVRRSIEKLFEVNVTSVRTMIVAGKYKRFGKEQGRTKRWKKAYVTLAPEQEIEIFEGV